MKHAGRHKTLHCTGNTFQVYAFNGTTIPMMALTTGKMHIVPGETLSFISLKSLSIQVESVYLNTTLNLPAAIVYQLVVELGETQSVH